MQQRILTTTTYTALFSILAAVYIIGLFVPLMDNDSAHHANIALRMYLTGDYVNLVDHGKDYLDKPHLHFWLAAFSYNIFGVTTFAYKAPSFLFTLLGTYSTFHLGKALYNIEIGRLAALIVASAFGYALANNDVRMDAILTASIIFAIWQLTEWINHKKVIYAIGAALGLAMGFATKGHIAVFTPGVAALAYILYKRDFKILRNWQFFLLIISFFIFISPVVYCYYLQYDLHPEKVIRGKSGRSGVEFILWKQNTERFQGDSFGADGKNDYFFFIHSFLWSFAPWSIIAFVALVKRWKTFITRQYEWLTVATITVIGLLISFSGFKLPHYLNIIFPVSAVLTASYLYNNAGNASVIKRLLTLQTTLFILLLLIAGAVNVWAFPVYKLSVITGFFLVLAAAYYFIKKSANKLQQLIIISVAATAIVFYLLNANFYPQLLTYQGGNEMAFDTKDKVDAKQVYMWPGIYSSSYNFYTSTLRKEFTKDDLNGVGSVWILADEQRLEEMKASGLQILEGYQHTDYEVSRLKLKFINPAKRKEAIGKMYLVRVELGPPPPPKGGL